MEPPAKNTSETGCRSHKVYLNSWDTEIGGFDRIQTNVNSSCVWHGLPITTIRLFACGTAANCGRIFQNSII
jgi:hypothetical protein